MVTRGNRYNRLGLRYAKAFGFFACFVCVAFLALVLFWLFFPASTFRTTILFASNPMTVASWDREKRHVTLVEIPASVTVAGITGVGEYSLESLWRLGELDVEDAKLLSESLSEALAVPIPWYVGGISFHAFITPGTLWKLITKQYRSNIPLRVLLPVLVATKSLRSDAFSTLNLAQTSAIIQKEQADGASVLFLDPDRLDTVLRARFEEEMVRKESIRVMIYNTTQTPALGRRMERRVSQAGSLVIGVTNSSPTVGRCEVLGSIEKINSQTARYFKEFFGCEAKVGEALRSDLELRVGRDFEKRFLP